MRARMSMASTTPQHSNDEPAESASREKHTEHEAGVHPTSPQSSQQNEYVSATNNSGFTAGERDQAANAAFSRAQGPAGSSSISSSTPHSETMASMFSVDSETGLLRKAHSHTHSSSSSASAESKSASHHPQANTSSSSSRPAMLQRMSTSNEPRRCWICFADETEDTPTSSAWKSPCPCALTAHESCILDWVADLEAPKRNQSAPRKIECPQCKSEIRIARPYSPVAAGVRRIDRFLSRLTVPGIGLMLFGSLSAGAWMHGLTSIYVVFGRDDFHALFGMQDGGQASLGAALSASLVPAGLVMARTNLVDSALPIFPVALLAMQYPERSRGAPLWPPTPAIAFVSLPYLRALYSLAWQYLFAAKERQWITEVNPNAATASGGIRLEWAVRPRQRPAAPAPVNQNVEEDEEDEEEIAFEAGLVDADAAHDHDHEQADENAAHPAPADIGAANPPVANNQPQNANNNAGAAGAAGAAPARAGAGNNGALENANQLIDTGGRIVDAVIGALSFPFVAAAAGEILRIALPLRWVVPGGAGLHGGRVGTRSAPSVTGLLQLRWGRSIVGGCLFVVLKDTLRLYARYRAAVSQRSRHVLDYEGKGGKGRDRKGRKRTASTTAPAAAA